MSEGQTNTAPAVEADAAPPAEPSRRSPWTLKQRILRVVWSLVGGTAWRCSPESWNGLRVAMLRAFGARVGGGVRVSSSVHIEIPWHLELGDGVEVGEGAILYCLGPVRIGAGTLVGPLVHICAGTHDHTSRAFTLLRSPIEIGADCLLLTAAFVGPGAVVADRTVVRERASIHGRTEPGTIQQGNPARVVGHRDAPPEPGS